MTTDTGVWLEDLTWPEAKARFEAGALTRTVAVGAAARRTARTCRSRPTP